MVFFLDLCLHKLMYNMDTLLPILFKVKNDSSIFIIVCLSLSVCVSFSFKVDKTSSEAYVDVLQYKHVPFLKVISFCHFHKKKIMYLPQGINSKRWSFFNTCI
uniref:Uncharacterized protein n=1 Tax=Ditylum brightwellii TaxID=49249 RepID=A0A7S1YQ52_9STRA